MVSIRLSFPWVRTRALDRLGRHPGAVQCHGWLGENYRVRLGECGVLISISMSPIASSEGRLTFVETPFEVL
jgi:hypothetical protein